MAAFEIRINGELVTRIDAGTGGSLTATAMHNGEWWRWFQGEELSLRLEGLSAEGTELSWPAPAMRPGDEVSIRLAASAPPNPRRL